MLGPARRPLVLGLVLAAAAGLSVFFHRHDDYIPSSLYRRPEMLHQTSIPEARLSEYCSRDDPFEAEYGRTNLRLSRAYEGESCDGIRTDSI